MDINDKKQLLEEIKVKYRVWDYDYECWNYGVEPNVEGLAQYRDHSGITITYLTKPQVWEDNKWIDTE